MRGMTYYRRRAVWREMDKHNQTTGDRMQINGFESKQAFIGYLRETLIPDLKESGRDMTAEDFETAIAYMTRGGK